MDDHLSLHVYGFHLQERSYSIQKCQTDAGREERWSGRSPQTSSHQCSVVIKPAPSLLGIANQTALGNPGTKQRIANSRWKSPAMRRRQTVDQDRRKKVENRKMISNTSLSNIRSKNKTNIKILTQKARNASNSVNLECIRYLRQTRQKSEAQREEICVRNG